MARGGQKRSLCGPSAPTARKAWLPKGSCTEALASTSRPQHLIQTLSITLVVLMLSLLILKKNQPSGRLTLPILSKFFKTMNQGWDVAW